MSILEKITALAEKHKNVIDHITFLINSPRSYEPNPGYWVGAYGANGNAVASASMPSLEETIAEVDKALAEREVEIHGAQIRKMASAIITATMEKGRCRDIDLRMADFSDRQIKRYGDLALEQANLLSDVAPFTIEKGNSNNAPEEIAAE